jgi:hypothetical protein
LVERPSGRDRQRMRRGGQLIWSLRRDGQGRCTDQLPVGRAALSASCLCGCLRIVGSNHQPGRWPGKRCDSPRRSGSAVPDTGPVFHLHTTTVFRGVMWFRLAAY